MECVNPIFRLSASCTRRAPHPFQFASQDVPHLVGLCVPVGYALIAFFEIVLIIATVAIDSPVVHFHHHIADAVEEVAVVGDHKQGAAGAFEVGFEIFNCVDVQMVGRLVHNEEVRLGGEHLRECDSFDTSAGKFLHRLSEISQPEVRQQPFHPQFIFQQAFLVKMLRKLLTTIHNLPENSFLRVEVIFLLQEGDAYILEKQNLSARIALVLSCENPHKRSLSRAIGRNKRNFVPLIYIESDMFKKNFRPIGF